MIQSSKVQFLMDNITRYPMLSIDAMTILMLDTITFFCLLLQLLKQCGFDRNEYHTKIEAYLYEGYTEEMVGDEKMGHHLRMVLDQNQAGSDQEKALVHANRWYFYMRFTIPLVWRVYSVKLSSFEGRRWFVKSYRIMLPRIQSGKKQCT